MGSLRSSDSAPVTRVLKQTIDLQTAVAPPAMLVITRLINIIQLHTHQLSYIVSNIYWLVAAILHTVWNNHVVHESSLEFSQQIAKGVLSKNASLGIN